MSAEKGNGSWGSQRYFQCMHPHLHISDSNELQHELFGESFVEPFLFFVRQYLKSDSNQNLVRPESGNAKKLTFFSAARTKCFQHPIPVMIHIHSPEGRGSSGFGEWSPESERK